VLADTVEISGDATAADNLEAQYDATGLSGDTFPATQAQMSSITNSGSAVNTFASSYTLTLGNQSSGTVASTQALDGTNHEHTEDASGDMDLYYEFVIGAGSPSSVTVDGYTNANNDDIGVFGYDWVTPGWIQIGTLVGKNQSTNETNTYPLTTAMVGTAANLGKARVRFYDITLSASATLAIDRIYLSFNQSAGGYVNGIEVDTNESNTNTVPGVDGVKGNPVSTWAAAQTLSDSTGINEFKILSASEIALNEDSTGYSLIGSEWDLALASQTIDGMYVEGANVSGISAATSTRPRWYKCSFGAGTYPPSIFQECGFGASDGLFTAASAGQYVMVDCFSIVAGSGTPDCTFAGLGSARASTTGGGRAGRSTRLTATARSRTRLWLAARRP